MAQRKKNIARWVLCGISVLGILFGLAWFLGAAAMLLALAGEKDVAFLWLGLGFSAVLLVLGAWLTRDSYLMLRGRAFGAVKSIPAFLALVFLGSVDSLLPGLGSRFVGEKRFVGDMVVFAAGLSVLLAAVVVYSICTKLLSQLVKAADSPEELSGTHHSTE